MVALLVAQDFLSPVVSMGLGQTVQGASFVSMPKASVDEDAGAESHDGKVGRARQRLSMDAVAEAVAEQETAYKHLGSCVFRPDSAHAVAALLGCHLVCHRFSFGGGSVVQVRSRHALLFLCHVFPIASGHVVELLLGVHTLANADGLEIGPPQFLQEFVILPLSRLKGRASSS